MSKQDDKKTALKLINKYAESYTILEEENKSIKIELKNLKDNLRINKEIIEGFFNPNTKKDKQDLYFRKLKEENEKLSQQVEAIVKEKNEMRNKVI
jgi:hypothetical protein